MPSVSHPQLGDAGGIYLSDVSSDDFMAVGENGYNISINDNSNFIGNIRFKDESWVNLHISSLFGSKSEMEFQGFGVEPQSWFSIISTTTISLSFGKSENITPSWNNSLWSHVESNFVSISNLNSFSWAWDESLNWFVPNISSKNTSWILFTEISSWVQNFVISEFKRSNFSSRSPIVIITNKDNSIIYFIYISYHN